MPAPTRDATERALQEALSLHQQGKLREAFAGYSAILARRPDYAPALGYAALVLHEAGNGRDAIARLERAVAIAPT